MVRSLYLVAVYLAIFGIGLGAPFLLTLGYVWVDIFRPENVAWDLLPDLPVAMVMGGAAIGSYLVLDRVAPPRISAILIFTLLFCGWVTATSFWAVVPIPAWNKWDWAFKGMLFSAFIPFVIRSRNQIEAFVQVYIFSLAANIIPFGAKTALSGGGGYAQQLGLINRNFFLGESDTLAAAAAMAIPLMLYLATHTRIIPRNRWTTIGYTGLALLAVLTIIGTHERAGILGLGVVACSLWIKSRQKLPLAALFAAIGMVIAVTAPTDWWERMSTMSNIENDGSITVRLKVWEWTLDYVSEHPNGGGFQAYRINEFEIPVKGAENGEVRIEVGRAYHSMFFEVLGEHGWLGLGLFLGLILLSFRALRQTVRYSRSLPHLAWARDLASALQASLLVMLTVGAFIGIAFQPFVYYIVALSVSLREYARRVLEQEPAPLLVGNESLALARP